MQLLSVCSGCSCVLAGDRITTHGPGVLRLSHAVPHWNFLAVKGVMVIHTSRGSDPLSSVHFPLPLAREPKGDMDLLQGKIWLGSILKLLATPSARPCPLSLSFSMLVCVT